MRVRRVALVLSTAVAITACSSGGRSGPTTSAGTTTSATGASASTTSTPNNTTLSGSSTVPNTASSVALTVLVTNDDGIGAPGLDAVVKALQQSPNFTVVVVAPATNQSGTGGKTTPGGAKGTKGSTKSGTSGTAVDGYPADSVNYAIDSMGLKPDVVVSGANSGVNFGALVAISGTIGAARAAARRGVPAIAVSAGVDDPVSAAAGAQFVVDEINAHRTAYGFAKNTDHTVVSINVPNCAAGTSVRGIIDAPTSPAVKLADIGKYETFDCASTATDPVDDITAVDVGFASRSIVPADL